MNFYVKTELEPSLYLKCLKYRLKYLSTGIILRKNIINELKDKYNTSLKEIIQSILKNIRCSEVAKNLKQIYFLNDSIKNSTLNELIKFLEYGSLEITSPRTISKYIKKAIILTKDDIGDM